MAWVRTQLCEKKGALDSQSQVITFTSFVTIDLILIFGAAAPLTAIFHGYQL
jgi:hypothetical protein